MSQHPDFGDLYELYALGVLEGEEREAVQEHLARNCEVCVNELERAKERNAQVFRAVPKLDPSPQLRTRVLAGFGIETRPLWLRALPWWSAAAAVAAMLIAGYFYWDRGMANANRDTASAMDFLGAPGTRQVSFGAGAGAPRGSVLVQQQKGLLLVVVNLPTPPAGKMYETWIVPKSGAPRPVGELRAAPGREAFAYIRGPVDAASIKAVAVSVEPAGSNPAAPAQVLFAAPLN